MTTITFDEPVDFTRNHFRNIDDFQLYIIQKMQKEELSPAHKSVINDRLEEFERNPENFITLDELKSSLKRK